MPPWFLFVAGVPNRAPVELAAGAWLGMHAPQDPGNRDTGFAVGGRLRLRWEEGWGLTCSHFGSFLSFSDPFLCS